MLARAMAVYFGLQFLSVNLMLVLGAATRDEVSRWVHISMLIVLPPVVGALVGRFAGGRLGDENKQEQFATANCMIGLACMIALFAIDPLGGRDAARSLFRRQGTTVRPQDLAAERRADTTAHRGKMIRRAIVSLIVANLLLVFAPTIGFPIWLIRGRHAEDSGPSE
jgi:hypothetical protein